MKKRQATVNKKPGGSFDEVLLLPRFGGCEIGETKQGKEKGSAGEALLHASRSSQYGEGKTKLLGSVGG